ASSPPASATTSSIPTRPTEPGFSYACQRRRPRAPFPFAGDADGMTPAAAPTSTGHALLRLVAAGGAVAPRRRLLEQHGSPEAALEAGPRGWRQAGLDAGQIATLSAAGTPDARTAGWLA